jgi:CDP-4-dehydro-6-deoxyglucose reductase, E1
MVCTNDTDLAVMLKIVRANGRGHNLDAPQKEKWRDKFNIPSVFQSKYTFYDLGYNLRPTKITGSLGLSQLKHLSNNIKKRIEHFLFLNSTFNENRDIISLDASHLKQHSPFSFPVLCVDSKLKPYTWRSFMELR